jgi:hypothetical protein
MGRDSRSHTPRGLDSSERADVGQARRASGQPAEVVDGAEPSMERDGALPLRELRYQGSLAARDGEHDDSRAWEHAAGDATAGTVR